MYTECPGKRIQRKHKRQEKVEKKLFYKNNNFRPEALFLFNGERMDYSTAKLHLDGVCFMLNFLKIEPRCSHTTVSYTRTRESRAGEMELLWRSML